MLRLYVESVNGEEFELHNLESVVIEKDLGVAADSMTVELTGIVSQELVSIKLYDEERLVFSGLIDEQNVNISNKEITELVCRSYAALLIDNEACPCNFSNPDTKLIFERYIKPLGIESFVGENKVFHGDFKVKKGMSCFEVLLMFSKSVYKFYPRIEGKLLVLEKKEKELVFSNQGGTPFYSLSFSLKRCVPISLVKTKTEDAGEYSTLIKNQVAIERNILRQRYLNASPSSGNSLMSAYNAIALSNEKDVSVIIYTTKSLVDALGARACVAQVGLNESSVFIVSGIRYSYSGKFECTKLQLKKENLYVDNTKYI